MPRKRHPTPDEIDLWRRAMRTTEPLPGRALPTPPVVTAPKLDKQPAPAAQPPARAEPSRDRPVPDRRTPFDGVDGATARRMRRGRQGVDGKIDLHGMRQDEAFAALTRFVLGSSRKGRRCVLVITGKGGRAESADDAPFMAPSRGTGEGVLKRMLPVWLAQEPLRALVFACEPAHQRDGGGGAFYVFLRRAG